eukprot:8911797-Pyramimonas_sp.AAC.1
MSKYCPTPNRHFALNLRALLSPLLWGDSRSKRAKVYKIDGSVSKRISTNLRHTGYVFHTRATNPYLLSCDDFARLRFQPSVQDSRTNAAKPQSTLPTTHVVSGVIRWSPYAPMCRTPGRLVLNPRMLPDGSRNDGLRNCGWMGRHGWIACGSLGGEPLWTWSSAELLATL